MLRHALPGFALAVALLLVPLALAAQDSLPPAPRRDSAVVAIPDTAAIPLADAPDTGAVPLGVRPLSPMGAFARSLLIPGWGQAKLGRRTTAILFVAAEAVTVGMAIKANQEYQYLRASGAPGSREKALEREDWLVLVAFNHLIAGVEAFVSAHLWDFPGDVALRPVHGGVGAGVTLPVRVP
jgi:hypothetical protein